jgi:uncharacterized protein
MLAVAMSLAGCTTYNQQNKFGQFYIQGDLANAEREATKKAEDKQDSKDEVIWRLEQATILRAAGKFQDSNKAFDRAEARIDKYGEEAKVKLANEAGAILSNQANLPYRGRAYDGIMLNTYKTLNYLQLGEPEKARVEITRAYIRQQDAVEENKKRIEKSQEAAEKSEAKANIEKARENDKFKGELDSNFAELNTLKPYADYVNPFTVYLEGLYYMTCSTGLPDLEKSRQAFQRVSAYTADNKFVKADQETLDALVLGKDFPATTYVIFETGRGPMREQIRIDIPIIITDVSYVGAAFPRLRFQGDFMPNLTVTATGLSETTLPIASLDSVVGQDFKNELPVIITKTLVSTITKAVAAYAVNHAAMQSDAVLGWVSRIVTAGAQAAVNIADERTWTTLPKEFQICRIPTPPDRKIELHSPSSSPTIPVTLGEGTVNVVFVKSISATGPLLVSQIKLK